MLHTNIGVKSRLGRAIFRRQQAMRQIADKIAYLMWIFGKHKAALRCPRDCLALTPRVSQEWACRFARLSQVLPCVSHANFIGSLTESWGSRAI